MPGRNATFQLPESIVWTDEELIHFGEFKLVYDPGATARNQYKPIVLPGGERHTEISLAEKAKALGYKVKWPKRNRYE